MRGKQGFFKVFVCLGLFSLAITPLTITNAAAEPHSDFFGPPCPLTTYRGAIVCYVLSSLPQLSAQDIMDDLIERTPCPSTCPIELERELVRSGVEPRTQQYLEANICIGARFRLRCGPSYNDGLTAGEGVGQ